MPIQKGYPAVNEETKEEKHELNRYVLLHEQILQLLEAKKIKPGEGFLLALVDGFCNHHTGQNCFASNTYLAKRIGLSVKRVEAMLGKLRKQELIKSKGGRFGEKRELWTCLTNSRSLGNEGPCP